MQGKDNSITIDRTVVLNTLQGFRHFWEQASGGESLAVRQASVGVVLLGFLKYLGFSDEEKAFVLGDGLQLDLGRLGLFDPVDVNDQRKG